MSPLPQVKKWYRGKSIVSDVPSLPSVQPPEEEEFFQLLFLIPVRGRLSHFLNQWPTFLWYKKKAGIETWSKRRVH
jgi:hypothetical protein